MLNPRGSGLVRSLHVSELVQNPMDMVAQSSSSSSSRSSSNDHDNNLKASLKATRKTTKTNSNIMPNIHMRFVGPNQDKKSDIAKAIVPFKSLADSVKRMSQLKSIAGV